VEEGGALGVRLREGLALEGGDGGGGGGGCWVWVWGERGEEGDGAVEVGEGCVGVLEQVGGARGGGGWWGVRLWLRLGLKSRLDEDGVAVAETDELGAIIVGGGVAWVGAYEDREGGVGGFEDGVGEW